MSNQNASNGSFLEFVKKAIKLRKTLAKRPFIQLTSKEQVQHLGNILEYRAQCSLYNVCKKCAYGTSWERYLTLLTSNSEIKKTFKHLITMAVTNFDASHLNFDIPEGEPLWDSDRDNSTVDFSPVLHPIQKKHFIDYLTIRSQIEHFHRLSASDPLYTWQKYCDDLHNDQNLWGKFSRAFQQGLWQIDFWKYWESVDTDEIVFQYGIANACYILEQRAKEKRHGWTSIFPNFWE